MEFGEIKEVVKAKAEHKWDEYHSPAQIEFHHFDALTVGNTIFRIAPSAKRLIGQKLKIPAPYIDRCPPDLQAQNLNYWLKELDKFTELFCRFEENYLRAIFTKRYKPMDHYDILQQLDIPDNTECIFRIDSEMMQLSVPDPSGKFEVAKGDELMPGVALTNSEVGIKAFSISAYYLRIVCTNGMLATDLISQKFRHTSTRGLDNFSDTMQLVNQKAVLNSERFKLAIDQEAENPLALIESFGRNYRLSRKEIKHVQSYYVEPNTMWSVINSFTAAANDSSLSVEKSNQLQFIGGKILGMVK